MFATPEDKSSERDSFLSFNTSDTKKGHLVPFSVNADNPIYRHHPMGLPTIQHQAIFNRLWRSACIGNGKQSVPRLVLQMTSRHFSYLSHLHLAM